MKKLLYSVVCTLLLNACATQNQSTRAEGTGIGCATGALLGAGLGALIGGDGKSAAIGAGAGAAAGCTAGYVYADSVVEERKELHGRENNLDAQIQVAQNINNSTQQHIENLSSKIAEFDRNVTRLKRSNATQASIRRDLKKQRQQIDLEIQQTSSDVAELKDYLDSLIQFRSNQQYGSVELDKQIKTLEINLAELEGHSRALASISQRL